MRSLTTLSKILLPLVCCISGIHAQEPVMRLPTVYVAPADGFESYMIAAIMRKHVPLVVVADPAQADYEVQIVAGVDQPFIWLKQVEVSMHLIERSSGTIVYAHGYHASWHNGKQYAAENCAKALHKYLRGKDRF